MFVSPQEKLLSTFIEEKSTGSKLLLTPFIWEFSQTIQDILKTDKKDPELQNMIEQLWYFSEAMEHISNPILAEDTQEYYLLENDDESDFDLWEIWEDISQESISENLIYDHTPMIAFFFQWKPVFISHNYMQAFWYNSLSVIQSDILSGKILQNYTPESEHRAKEAIMRLRRWEKYRDLELHLKNGKIIKWNSYGDSALEIRIWIDVTEAQNQDILSGSFPWFHMNTNDLITNIRWRLRWYISNTDIIKLEIIREILNAFTYIWNEWPYLMNIIVDKGEEKIYLPNKNCSNAYKLPCLKMQEKHRKWTLFTQHYDEETQYLIEGLLRSLYENPGYYLETFPLIDNDWQRKVYNWFRHRLSIKGGSIGIGRDFFDKWFEQLLRDLKK